MSIVLDYSGSRAYNGIMSLRDARRDNAIDREWEDKCREQLHIERNKPNPDPVRVNMLAHRLMNAMDRASASYDRVHRFDDER